MEGSDDSVRHIQLVEGWASHHNCYRVEKLLHMMAVVHGSLFHRIVLAPKMAAAGLVDANKPTRTAATTTRVSAA
ncbi:hypothetical protein M7I_5391 [Glarea lozoyensis 74030]|uniref:Uncharacterized protein n=1 Tax=Glarea lozoyensis (strain ATCC 74030 / MF5533) TaxID=1104152 RepID=H0ERS0_GLAL7|nr:hypothetical protein M7I_5391 [Glarea lozoyensis 74030]